MRKHPFFVTYVARSIATGFFRSVMGQCGLEMRGLITRDCIKRFIRLAGMAALEIQKPEPIQSRYNFSILKTN